MKLRFALLALALLGFGSIGLAAAPKATATATAVVQSDCDTDFPGFPIAPPCPPGQTRDINCFLEAQASYEQDWNSQVQPLAIYYCFLDTSVDRLEDYVAGQLENLARLMTALEQNNTACEAGDLDACDLAEALEAGKTALEADIARNQETIETAKALRDQIEGELLAAEEALVNAYLSAVQDCCSGDQ